MKVRTSQNIVRNSVLVYVFEDFGRDDRRFARISTAEVPLGFRSVHIEWEHPTPGTETAPTFEVPIDVWDAIVEAAVLEHAGKMPSDVLLKERLDIETARVDKLLEALVSDEA